jgi:hypothetical protein
MKSATLISCWKKIKKRGYIQSPCYQDTEFSGSGLQPAAFDIAATSRSHIHYSWSCYITQKKSNAKHLTINSRTFNQPIILFFNVQFETLSILFCRAN